MGCRLDVPKTEHRENYIRNQCVRYMDRTLLRIGDRSSGRSLVLDANGGGIGPELLGRSYLQGGEGGDIEYGQGWSI